MATIVFVPADFRAMFPAYADETKYPDEMLTTFWEFAKCYFDDEVCGCFSEECWKRILYTMVAHLLYMADAAQQGNSGLVQSATIDKVSVTQAAPPYGQSQYRYWMNQSPWGQQLLALLSTCAVGGMYIGGAPETRALRKFRGKF